MLKKSLTISLAFVGVLVGAGFASGQEIIQYFVSFGWPGFLGVIVSSAIIIFAGSVLLQLGSYYLAEEHSTVFRNATHPVVSKLLDGATMITLFAMSFAMLAGAGANMNQQFGLPVWVGATVMVLLVFVCGFLPVDKVTNVISMVTPLILIAVAVAAVVTLMNLPDDLHAVAQQATQERTASGVFDNWFISAVNYVGMNLMMGLSMALLIGGDQYSPKEAARGGLMGGILFSVLLSVLTFVIFFNIEAASGQAMPLLAVFDSFHPIVGVIVAIIILAMIFNTAIGMFYPLGQRLAQGDKKKFRWIYPLLCVVSFVISFIGFTDVVGYIFPIIGYLGCAMLAVLGVSWFKSRKLIAAEIKRRGELIELARQGGGSTRVRGEARRLVEESDVDNDRLIEKARAEADGRDD